MPKPPEVLLLPSLPCAVARDILYAEAIYASDDAETPDYAVLAIKGDFIVRADRRDGADQQSRVYRFSDQRPYRCTVSLRDGIVVAATWWDVEAVAATAGIDYAISQGAPA